MTRNAWWHSGCIVEAIQATARRSDNAACRADRSGTANRAEPGSHSASLEEEVAGAAVISAVGHPLKKKGCGPSGIQCPETLVARQPGNRQISPR